MLNELCFCFYLSSPSLNDGRIIGIKGDKKMKSKEKSSTYANQSVTVYIRDKYKSSLPRDDSLTHPIMYNSHFKGCII